MKRYPEAVEDDTKAIELDPLNAKLYKSRAMTLQQLSREEAAQQDEIRAKDLSAKSNGT